MRRLYKYFSWKPCDFRIKWGLNWKPRLHQHIIIALLSSGPAALIFYAIEESENLIFRLSMASGYIGLALIGASLIIGPWRILHSNPNPLSTNLRRDIGIWAAIYSIIHVVIGLQAHMRGKFWLYFIYPPDKPHFIPFRYDPFGFANYTGLGVTLVLIVLLVISNNFSMRKLGTGSWKKIQRWNYVGGGLVILHCIAYQLISKRSLPFVTLFSVIALVVLTFQMKGFIRRHKGDG